MSEKTIKGVLENIGLTGKEAEVYIHLAKRGALKGVEIAKQLRKHKAQIYRILRRLQTKGLVESTLEAPTRFIAIPFEKALDQFIKTKQEEADFIARTKEDWLRDWEKISRAIVKPTLEKFSVIEGNKKIYLKILQMIRETKGQLSAILTIPALARAEYFGVFDAAYKHPLKSKIKFRFITELSKQNLKAIKLLMPKLRSELNLKGINDPSLELLSRMVIKDEEEILFFISLKTDMFRTGQGETCLCTNCKSLIH